MGSKQSKLPDSTICDTDIGDDIQRRFRYQAAQAAVLSLALLSENPEFDEIFCEHHEDTLVKKKDGSFIGIQVKTRMPGRDPFKSDNVQILKSINRFVELEIQFPDKFSKFVIATNYAFWSERNTAKNLQFLLKLAREAVGNKQEKLHRGLSDYIKKITKLINNQSKGAASQELVLKVLSKIALQDDWPKFDDIESRIAMHIPEFFDIGEAGYDDLLRAAKALINKMFTASSLQHTSAKQLYISMCLNPEKEKTDLVIEGKRITKEKIQSVLIESLTGDILLRKSHSIRIQDLPKGMNNLEMKMSKGGISASNISHAKDHKFSVEKLLYDWIYKYSPVKANKRYDHLNVMVGNECQETYDMTYTVGENFGTKMLIELRNRLRKRHKSEMDSLFGCRYEHLLGVAGILTELCDVWWSDKFELPEDV